MMYLFHSQITKKEELTINSDYFDDLKGIAVYHYTGLNGKNLVVLPSLRHSEQRHYYYIIQVRIRIAVFKVFLEVHLLS